MWPFRKRTPLRTFNLTIVESLRQETRPIFTTVLWTAETKARAPQDAYRALLLRSTLAFQAVPGQTYSYVFKEESSE